MNPKKTAKKSAPSARGQAPQKAVAAVSNKNAFAGWESYLERNATKLLLLLPLLLGVVLATLTFEMKISEGNDDAMYIEAATKYAAHYTGYFYTANAPLYPMLLGLVDMVTGFHLTLFKLINTILFLVQLALMYLAFRRRLPYTVLLPVLLLASVNSYNLYYASQTYTEMLFLCLQALFFIVFFHQNEKLAAVAAAAAVPNQNHQQAKTATATATNTAAATAAAAKYALSIGFALLLLTLCKNIAIGTLGAVLLFFAIQKKWKPLFLVAGGFVVARVTWEVVKGLIWGFGNQYGSQGAILLQKDAYNPSAGQEDLSGFVTRFFTNFDLYISKRLFQILGFQDPEGSRTYTILSLGVLALLVFVAWQVYQELKELPSGGRKTIDNASSATASRLPPPASRLPPPANRLPPPANRLPPTAYPFTSLMMLLYVVVMHALTFIILQVKWDQPRLIMVYVPLLVCVVLYGFYRFLGSKGTGGRVAYLAIAGLIVGSSFLTSARKAVEHLPVLKKNIAGDHYYGYTPDWENFLKLSAWCADSLPPGSLVASRKAPMSFVYGKGKPFFPVYSVVALDSTTGMSNADSVLNYFRTNHVTHVLLGSLRRNPQKADGTVINTMHRTLQPIAQKYPEKLKLVKQMGTVEPSYLYELRY